MQETDVITDLCSRLHTLWLRAQVVFGTLDIPHNIPYPPLAEALARGLAAADDVAVAHVRAIVDPAECEKVEFWRTPLGRLLFLAGGHELPHCSQSIAAAVLGVSRQWVSALVARDKLTQLDGGVRTDEVRRLLQARVDTVVNRV